jgi:hypothetical protein
LLAGEQVRPVDDQVGDTELGQPRMPLLPHHRGDPLPAGGVRRFADRDEQVPAEGEQGAVRVCLATALKR